MNNGLKIIRQSLCAMESEVMAHAAVAIWKRPIICENDGYDSV